MGRWRGKKKDGAQGTLSIEKTGATYKCVWKIEEKNTKHECLGIGMMINNQLIISRASVQTPIGGIGIYRPIGDLRSNSSLWASFQKFDTLGSGIAVRKYSSENFDGNYKVRYFLNGTETAGGIFNLKIVKRKNDLYSLTWDKEGNVIYHGIGMINNGEMALAWGDINIDHELIILDIVNENEKVILKAKCALLSKGIVTEEFYIKKDLKNV